MGLLVLWFGVVMLDHSLAQTQAAGFTRRQKGELQRPRASGFTALGL